jgi:hypothetical protein
MICEFALDPRILNRWETYDRLVNDCGVEHGRLISDFPNRWKKMVWEAVLANPAVTPVESQRIEFHLQHRVGSKLLPTNRRYDFANVDWLLQAEREHDGGKPFQAIVAAENPRQRESVIVASDLDRDNDPRWRVDRSVNVPRTAEKLAEKAGFLLRISQEIRFIDPHFGPETGRYRRSLKTLLRALASLNSKITVIEIHLEARSTRDFFERECRERLPSCIPRGIQVRLFRWKERQGGERLHRRMILTERGGIEIEGGLDVGKDGETTDLFLLNSQQRAQHWRDCDHKRPVDADESWKSTFEPEREGPVIVNGTAHM